ncbi:hypothetical protein K461DRAFT_228634 [Myriangium duriaei CBS 260.36]|uniref:Large ribosomal subunit protein bL21m n=1 Tax=Myriangium duriaei CBS 260.36 TaxID=1168546 RepID=A0A9P4IZH2_9PEZI|nr:hypothetical protein K461DRAFT_228634 [Myriangium duriaei CBS 260.36]
MTLLSRSLRRAALDTQWSLPPTFLCPWTATLTTQAHGPAATSSPPPGLTSTALKPPSAKPSRSVSRPKLPSPPSFPGPSSTTPPQFSDSITTLLPSLISQSAQAQLYITIHLHAHGFLVTQGDTIRLPFLLNGVEPGDILRLNRAINLGTRDFTLRAPAKERRGKSATVASQGRIPYLDERLFVCRAVVMGVEAEPMRVLEKTKRRQRHTKHVRSKHKYTVLKIKELRVRSLEEIEAGKVD